MCTCAICLLAVFQVGSRKQSNCHDLVLIRETLEYTSALHVHQGTDKHNIPMVGKQQKSASAHKDKDGMATHQEVGPSEGVYAGSDDQDAGQPSQVQPHDPGKPAPSCAAFISSMAAVV